MKTEFGESNTTAISIIILFALAFMAVVIPVAMKRQGRKDCLEMQRMEQEYPNYQVKPQINEYCVTKYNIQFKP